MYEYAWARVKDCVAFGMCHECLAKRMPAAVERHVKQHFHYGLPCTVCGELFEVPFADRPLYGKHGEIFESGKSKLRPWLCEECTEAAMLRRAEKRAKHDADAGATVVSSTPALE